MYSKLLSLFAIASLIMISNGVAGAFAEESEITYDVFDNPPKFFGDDMIIVSPGKSVDGIANAGSISVIDADTNSLLYTINNPDPTENDLFGRNIATSDIYIVVGVQEKTPVYGNYLSAKIYVFDGKTGSLLHAIKNPGEDKSDVKFHSTFGRSIGSIGDNVISGAYFEQSGDGFPTHLMYVFDGKTGSLLYTIDSPIPGSVSFGQTFESFDDKLVVYTRDADPNDEKNDDVIHVFDGKTGSLLYTINDPLPNTDSDFGRHFTIVGDNIVVGVPVWGSDNRFSGVMHVFDGNTGSLLYTVNDPAETERDFDRRFGESVVPAGNNIAVRSNEMVYIFEGSTGELLRTLDSPNLSNVELDMIVSSFEDDAPFFGILVYFENLFSQIMPSSQEDAAKTHVATFDFEGDELGNYEKWCLENNGDWLRGHDCGFTDSKDHKQARDSLRALTDVYVEGKPAKDACEFLELLRCDVISSLPAKFDMRTGQYTFKHFVDYKDYEIRVHGDGIQYRPNSDEEQDESSWIDYESDN